MTIPSKTWTRYSNVWILGNVLNSLLMHSNVIYALFTAWNVNVVANSTIHIWFTTQRQDSYIHQQHLQNRFARWTQTTRHIFGTNQPWICDFLIGQYDMSSADHMPCSKLISYLYHFWFRHLKKLRRFFFFLQSSFSICFIFVVRMDFWIMSV